MRLFKFAKWWWDKNDAFIRTVACTALFWWMPCAISAIWVGSSAAFSAAFFGSITVGVGWGLYGVFWILRDMWNKFNDENPSDDIAIMRKLKGIPTPSKERDAFYLD